MRLIDLLERMEYRVLQEIPTKRYRHWFMIQEKWKKIPCLSVFREVCGMRMNLSRKW